MINERKSILKMIEEGKITVEEGIKLLEALDKNEASNINHLKKEAQEAMEKLIRAANKGTTKLIDVVGKSLHKVSEMELDLDFDTSLRGGIKVTKNIELSSLISKKLYFSTEQGSLRFTTWEKENANVQITAWVSKVKDEAGGLEQLSQVIEQKEEEDQFNFFVHNSKYIRVVLEITLPYQAYDALHIKTKNGSVQIIDLKAKCVSIETTNGRVYLLGQYQDIECETTNGNIRIEQKEMNSCKIKASTSNGSVRVLQIGEEYSK